MPMAGLADGLLIFAKKLVNPQTWSNSVAPGLVTMVSDMTLSLMMKRSTNPSGTIQ